jgi:hypothetical protein
MDNKYLLINSICKYIYKLVNPTTVPEDRIVLRNSKW